MNRVAIAFSTCDRTELSRQSIEPLLQPGKFDLHWVDGSKTREGIAYACLQARNQHLAMHEDVTGGSGAAIIYALSKMLGMGRVLKNDAQGFSAEDQAYDYIGLVENDVLLENGWFDKTMALFEQGTQDGLTVGAVSARCYEDRILIQRPGYAICHNLGAGMVIFTREAAQLVLNQYRTQWTTENRAVFAQLTSTDIGAYWAFRGSEHFLVSDWRWDALLASHGYASLALTPSPVQMLGQVPPLEEQGLTIATGPVTDRIDDKLFETYRDRLQQIREGKLILPDSLFHRDTARGQTIFAHQIAALGGRYEGSWKLRDAPGFGPFGWIADNHQDDFDSRIFIPVYGPCEVMLGGGKEGGQVHIVDEASGFDSRPVLPPEGPQGQLIAVTIPGNCTYRTIRITMTSPGCCFYAIRCRDDQPAVGGFKFDWNTLPHGRVEL
jgi:hypothetical protein